MSALVPPLPVIGTLRTAFQTVFLGHARNLPPALAFPLLFSIGIELAFGWMSGRVIVGSFKSPLALTLFIWAEPFLQIIPYVIFVVAWHRVVLADERPSWGPSWQGRHWGIVYYLFLAAIVTIPIALLAPIVLQLILVNVNDILTHQDPQALETLRYSNLVMHGALTLVFAWFGARLGLVIPATAMEHKFDVVIAWRLSRGNGLRIMLAGLAVYLFFLAAHEIVEGALAWLRNSLALSDPTKPIDWLSSLGYKTPIVLLECLGIAVAVSVVSLAYRHCTATVPSAASTRQTRD